MAAPEFVPTKPTDRPRAYASPPRYEDQWVPDRPGELVTEGGQPDRDAGRMGSPGPDQGYVLKLAPLVAPELRLADGEQAADVQAALVAIALKRASLYGRAPVIHDLRVAAEIWGLFDASPPPELVEERRRRFEGVHLVAHHYPELRSVVDAVPAESLRLTPTEVAERHAADWRSLLSL